MTRKGQPKVRTGCLTCKSRKVKCDEAKPACVRCTSTGRKCDGYAVVVPSNRALARARSRTMRLNAALAQASAAWDGDMDEEKVLEHFRRKIAPMMPGHLEGQFWTDIMPRMSRTEPSFRQAMAVISSLMPGLADDADEGGGGSPQAAADPYSRVMRVLGGNTRKQKPGVDSQALGGGGSRSGSGSGSGSGQTRASSHPFSVQIDSPASSSSASLPSTGRLSATPLPDSSSRAEHSQASISTSTSASTATTTALASPQPYEDEGEADPRTHSEVNITLTGCLLFITVDFLRHGLEAAMEQLASGIEVLNNVDYSELAPTTVTDVLPKFYRLSIIQLCFYERPGFPTLNLNYGAAPRYDLGPYDKKTSIYRPQCAVDTILLDAITYIRSASPDSRTDSRLNTKGGPLMDAEQTALCGALDRWHAAFAAFIREPRRDAADTPLPPHTDVIRAETEMKYLAARICVCVCRSLDESVYDHFREGFRRIVALARDIYARCPELPPDSTQYSFSFQMSYLPLLEFVIAKCRWLDVRHQAYTIVAQLARRSRVRDDPVTTPGGGGGVGGGGGLRLVVGARHITAEHNAKMDEITAANARLFSLPAEEMRVRDYRTDARFADLMPAIHAEDRCERPLARQVPYTQRLLLRCGSYELDETARWVARDTSSSSSSSVSSSAE
ncbi:Aspercryptin biosynthesis cluster-specific transcription regulator atnN [Colletotrichum orbiculare MAFF 240422]|uniref:Aspercryptin biosynthesis cluster-specific transcription regulator atnN n=1 Tax=Colletotrichum orbiculare (strain 104-T / ATCC 96160 / CBS 514.97 / LARS 414 / MAFF 240422) TaxID=1213857 RepID=A0A484FKI5_COLOR|nr:Aspercryptin biosynthesis cluster-specific transcription regulator atnN [Colletotrichum orbiculare MAFF 240422]